MNNIKMIQDMVSRSLVPAFKNNIFSESIFDDLDEFFRNRKELTFTLKAKYIQEKTNDN